MAETEPRNGPLSDGHIPCPSCEGEGTVQCDDCGGRGTTTHECDRGYEHDEDCSCEDGMVECWECGGSGEILDPDQETDEGL